MELSPPLSVRIELNQREELKKRALELGVTETVAIRLAIALFLKPENMTIGNKCMTKSKELE